MDFLDLVKSRYSVSAYKNQEVEEEKLEKILEAARLAPTAVNYQPFKLIIIHAEGREEVALSVPAPGNYLPFKLDHVGLVGEHHSEEGSPTCPT